LELSYWRIENIFFSISDAMLVGSQEDRGGPDRHAPTLKLRRKRKLRRKLKRSAGKGVGWKVKGNEE